MVSAIRIDDLLPPKYSPHLEDNALIESNLSGRWESRRTGTVSYDPAFLFDKII